MSSFRLLYTLLKGLRRYITEYGKGGVIKPAFVYAHLSIPLRLRSSSLLNFVYVIGN
jgi:hypothetical protein